MRTGFSFHQHKSKSNGHLHGPLIPNTNIFINIIIIIIIIIILQR